MVSGRSICTQYDALGCLSINRDHSFVLDSNGAELFRLAAASVLSVHPEGWVAVSHGAVRMFAQDGTPLWNRPAPIRRDWGLCQACCDSQGRVYAPVRDRVLYVIGDDEVPP
ncbi:MAG: hypothetical protein KC910_13860 [Candidatus Eremiobacteraeota bacterium]|nr:hypothetical protein [Candidatus Eremiobacteraeota bacterium]